MHDAVFAAKAKITEIKLSQASASVQDLAARLTAADFPTRFTIDKLEFLRNISAEIDALSASDRVLLDFTKYNKLVDSYGNYVASVNDEATAIKNTANNGAAAAAAMAAVLTGAAAAAAVVLKRVLF